jgi:hypothetical protein
VEGRNTTHLFLPAAGIFLKNPHKKFKGKIHPRVGLEVPERK